MRLLQMHEYHRFLAAGVKTYAASEIEALKASTLARAIWPDTGLRPWEDCPRPIAHTWISVDGSHIGLHIAADHKDCFVIVVLELPTFNTRGYIVFDIGAEYQEAIFVCPSASFEGPAERDVILESIPRLGTHKDPYAILGTGDGTYMQVCLEDDGSYRLEHQMVTTKCHYEATGPIGTEDAIKAFMSYAFGKKEWATDFTWTRIDL